MHTQCVEALMLLLRFVEKAFIAQDRLACTGEGGDPIYVATKRDPEITVLTPAGTVTVLHNPVFLVGILVRAPSHHEHRMVDALKVIADALLLCLSQALLAALPVSMKMPDS